MHVGVTFCSGAAELRLTVFLSGGPAAPEFAVGVSLVPGWQLLDVVVLLVGVAVGKAGPPGEVLLLLSAASFLRARCCGVSVSFRRASKW